MIPAEVVYARDAAMADESYQNRCVMGEKVYYVAADKAYSPGHIYSRAGVDEFRISKCCEWHFDKWFIEDEDLDDEPLA